MTRDHEWHPDSNVACIVRADEGGWAEVIRFFAEDRDDFPLIRLKDLCNGQDPPVQTILIERRYVDPDYRSEHASFYSSTFQRYPAICHRLHFFSAEVTHADVARLDDFQDAYRGYSIIRPLPWAPVGRTMITPPAELLDRGGSVCTVLDEVRPFGCRLTIEAVPFTSQDTQYNSCAHAAQWVVHYHAHLRRGFPRYLPNEIHDASLRVEFVGRHVPTGGLTFDQLLSGLDALGLSPAPVRLPVHPRAMNPEDPLPPWPEKERSRGIGTLFGTVCSYVDSQMPPIIIGPGHAWVVVGYVDQGGSDPPILYIHDDQMGPYCPVADPRRWLRDWLFAVAALPKRLYVTTGQASAFGRLALVDRLDDEFPGRAVQYRTYAVRSKEFKGRLDDREHRMPDAVTEGYRLAFLPGFIWVVEAVLDDADEHGRRVVGEALIDSTAHEPPRGDRPLRHAILAAHVAGIAEIADPDFREFRRIEAPSFAPYSSGCLKASW